MPRLRGHPLAARPGCTPAGAACLLAQYNALPRVSVREGVQAKAEGHAGQAADMQDPRQQGAHCPLDCRMQVYLAENSINAKVTGVLEDDTYMQVCR